VVLELGVLVVVFGLWFLSGFDLDPAASVSTDPLWNYLAGAGVVGVVAVVAAAVAAWQGAVVMVVSQVFVAVLVCVVVFGGVAVQFHQDQRCRDVPSAMGCGEPG